jgi:hypothetical protein
MSLLAAVLVAAPVPKDAPAPQANTPRTATTAATGPAPRLLLLKPDADGKVRVEIARKAANNGGIVLQIGAAPGAPGAPGGAPGGAGGPVIINQIGGQAKERIEIDKLEDIKIATVGGKQLDRAEGLKQLAKGGPVIVSGDGNAVSPEFLKIFKDDVLIVMSKDLATPVTAAMGGFNNGGGVWIQPAGQPRAVPGAPRQQPAPAPKDN